MKPWGKNIVVVSVSGGLATVVNEGFDTDVLKSLAQIKRRSPEELQTLLSASEP